MPDAAHLLQAFLNLKALIITPVDKIKTRAQPSGALYARGK